MLKEKLKSNAVVTVKVPENIAIEAKKILESRDNIIASRVISIPHGRKKKELM